MRHALLLIVLATASASGADAWNCLAIKDADQRNSCLAASKNELSYCFKAEDADARAACHAPIYPYGMGRGDAARSIFF